MHGISSGVGVTGRSRKRPPYRTGGAAAGAGRVNSASIRISTSSPTPMREPGGGMPRGGHARCGGIGRIELELRIEARKARGVARKSEMIDAEDEARMAPVERVAASRRFGRRGRDLVRRQSAFAQIGTCQRTDCEQDDRTGGQAQSHVSAELRAGSRRTVGRRPSMPAARAIRHSISSLRLRQVRRSEASSPLGRA